MWRVRPLTFPFLEPFGSMVAGTVAAKVHHAENEPLGLILPDHVITMKA